MNGKQAKRIAEKARRLNGGSCRSGTVTIQHRVPVEPKKRGFLGKVLAFFKAKGRPMPPVPGGVTLRNTGFRATYRMLKREFIKVPRPEREAWLRSW